MAENHFTSTIESLFKGMDQFVTTKTVVGEPVQTGDTIIIPLIDVTAVWQQELLQKVLNRKTRAAVE